MCCGLVRPASGAVGGARVWTDARLVARGTSGMPRAAPPPARPRRGAVSIRQSRDAAIAHLAIAAALPQLMASTFKLLDFATFSRLSAVLGCAFCTPAKTAPSFAQVRHPFCEALLERHPKSAEFLAFLPITGIVDAVVRAHGYAPLNRPGHHAAPTGASRAG